MTKILGLDLGTNSIGWALLDTESQKIIDAGVRVFQEGVARTPTGSEESKNAQRRNARGLRKQNARFKMRRDLLIKILTDLNWYLPESKDAFYKMNPYELRKRGLDEALTLPELGRAIFHLSMRRGFKSNRRAGAKDDSKIFTGYENIIGISETENKIKEGHYRSLGEYLASINSRERRIRGRFTLRKMYESEFEILWEKQKEFHTPEMTDEVKWKLYNDIFKQRKLKSQKRTVRYCTFEPNKKCAPKSSPIFQYYRILEQVSRLKISCDNRSNEPLTDDERFRLITALNEKKELKFEQIKKLLSLPQDAFINLEDQEKLLGNRTEYELSRVFGKKNWSQYSADEKYQIWHTLHFCDDNDWLKKYASEKWKLDEISINKLLDVSLEKGYCNLSAKALKRIIPHLEDGLTYDRAALEAGYNHSQPDQLKEVQDLLPEPENLRNPIVQQTLFELRKLINNLFNTYGKPEIARVELLRELKSSREQRQNIQKEMRIREKEIARARDRIKEIPEYLGKEPSRDDIVKYLLWEECKGICPYTGNHIPLSSLFTGEYHVDHIIPYSRSLDNSFANKTLCHHSTNIEKGNRTPYEAYASDPVRWNEIVQRVTSTMRHKLRKFLLTDVAAEVDDDFFHHQMTDTAYISTEVNKYLKNVCPKVQITKGGATAILRQLWGLNTILSPSINIKTRDDHRHHAIDALVIANVNPGTLHRLSLFHKFNKNVPHENFPEPWPNFRNNAEEVINKILVSHRRNVRVRGKLHEETYYGKITAPDNGRETYVVRKPLAGLTPKMIVNIVDPVVKKMLINRLIEKGVDVGEKFTIPKDAWNQPLFMPDGKTPIKSVRVKCPTETMIRLYQDRKIFVESGNNHHLEIFVNPETGKRIGRVVSLFEATKRLKQKLPLIDKTAPVPDYKFLMSLAINELILVDISDIDWDNPPPSTELSPYLYRVQKMDVNQIITLRHHTVSILKDETGNEPGVLRKNINTINGIKVSINHLGKIRKADD